MLRLQRWQLRLLLQKSAKQKKMANEFGKAQRPGYEIPQAYKDYLAQTKFNASVSGLPGQAQLENKLQRQQASSIARSIQSQGSAAERNMAAAAGDFATKQTLEDTAYDAARFKAARQQEYNTAQQVMAKQQLAQWDWDKKQRYLDSMGAQSALTESANKNAMTALEGLTGAFQTAGMMGLFGAGDRAAGGGTAAAPGAATTPATTAATPTVATPAAAPTAPNWAAGPMLGTDFDPLQSGYSFQDPNDPSYNYMRYNNTGTITPGTPIGYDIYKDGKNVGYSTMDERAGGSIADYDPFISSIMQPRVAGSDMAFPDMQLSPNTPMPGMTGDMNDYGPGARRAMRRAGGETSQFNVSLPSQMTDNWTNDYFGMEMPTAYGYGNTWNDIMSRIGTQYGLGDVYSDGFNTNLNRQYSRFNPFG
jgi:hypothetical protein